jgi:dTMP kinase
MHLQGTLIVIDGADAAGKATQTKLLEDSLVERGVRVTVFDFPQYGYNTFGRTLRKALTGAYGNFREVSPYIASWLWTLDRVVTIPALCAACTEGVVLCNRYVPSNIAYQAAKLPDEEQDAFIEFLEDAEYDVLGIPRPDCVIYLSVPAEVSQKLMQKRGGRLDQHEADVEYQRRVNAVYHKLAVKDPWWHIIECAPHGELLAPQKIHAEVVNAVYEAII